VAQKMISHYRILEKLGKGGMGEVYLAEDTKHHDRKVALKLLHLDFVNDENLLRRFKQEARGLLALNHPNILTIYEIGQDNSAYFIATEFIEGTTLRRHTAHRQLKIDEALDISIQIASALSAAHGAGIIHRDIKPENVMLRPDGYVKVLDFGLAKLAEREAEQEKEQPHDHEALTLAFSDTSPGAVIGTTGYMSPEQARGLPIDARTDIFSLGVILYEMVTGRPPFHGATKSDVLAALLEREPAPVARYAPDTPQELQRIIWKALAKDKETRYQTVKDLLIDLKQLKKELEFEIHLSRSSIEPGVLEAIHRSGGATLHSSAGSTREPFARTSEISAAQTAASGEALPARRKRYWPIVIAAAAVLAVAAASIYFYSRQTRAITSVAVLPFVNASDNPSADYLSDGITESIINSLSQLPKLKVMSRSAVFRYKGKPVDPLDVGRKLGVGAIVTGTVEQIGDSLIVKTELVDVSDGSQLWGEQYNRNFSDIIAVQNDIAWKISEKLRLKLTGEDARRVTKRYTDNPEAYQLYLKGRYFWNKRDEESLKTGIKNFQDAIRVDPSYALAYSGMADSYALLADIGAVSPNDAMPKAKAAAGKAIELDHELAEAYTSRAFIKLAYDWDWTGAESDFKQALNLNPNYPTAHQWYASYLMQMGRYDEAREEIKRAQQLDPLSLIIGANSGLYLYFSHDYDGAIEQYRRTLEIDPNFYIAHFYLGKAYAQKKMYNEAITEFQRLVSAPGDNLEAEAALANAYAQSGRRADAQKILAGLLNESQQRYVSPLYIATVYTGLGDRDKAIEWLNKAYDSRHPGLVLIRIEPMFDTLRSDARFQELLHRFDRNA